MAKYVVDEILGVLDYGVPIERIKVLKCGLFLPVVFPIITLGMAITVWSGEMKWDSEMTGMAIGLNVCAVIVFSIFAYMLIRNKSLKENIAVWLNDAVEIEAKITNLYPQQPRATKLEVSFLLDGKEVHIRSTSNIFTQSRNSMFAAMGDSDRKILYSPKYNRVLFPIESEYEE